MILAKLVGRLRQGHFIALEVRHARGIEWGMVASSSEFQTKILRRSTDPDEYNLYRAALEWDLTDPIVIETRKDLKSEKRWQNQLQPYHHQVTNLITFCRRLPVTLLADDVGLGKTISAGLVASELIARARVSKILIVCPKLLGPQWRDELQTKFEIPAEIAVGKELIAAEPEDVSAVITTYASARLHLDKIPDDRFQMLVLDEAHKLRNLYGVDPPPQVALRFKEALEKRRFRYVLMLTATPIQNRLWDLYSLVDLLTVARGHQNPFGSEGMFARKFISDNRETARQLKHEVREEFRSIVYGYMSRVRRGDAKLYFPERVVQLHRVEPTPAELELIRVIAKPIQRLDRRTQISILQALVSSPHALMAQLTNMARNGTVPQDLAAAVCSIVGGMRTSAKLQGLGVLIDQLMRQNPERWRMVVFTTRLETQTTIQAFLEERGLKVGIINGSSGRRNQDTIKRFWKNPPECHVIVSTEAGSEGVNLQVANVLVNYDLPWNPMIVEQRIGRIQRLASEHAKVSILNIILKDTFEEFIVGRLMQKLQMAAHAIGDIEALLEAAGIDDDEDNGGSFDDKILQLVLAALAGKDVEKATRQAEESILEAKAKLEAEEANINAVLGSMEGAEYVGPRAPKLPPIVRLMDAREFTLAALKSLGAQVTPQEEGLYLLEQDGGREWIRFDDGAHGERRATLYAAGSAAFSRLVSQMIASGVHRVQDADNDAVRHADEITCSWVGSFGATPISSKVEGVRRCFEGKALVRVRATVAHDSYERLVEVTCAAGEHKAHVVRSGLYKLTDVIDNAHHLGIDTGRFVDAAGRDPGIAEFCRFYMERRAQEMAAAGDDARKRKKLEDDFTPRLELTVVALEGTVHREITTEAQYRFDDGQPYASRLTVVPRARAWMDAPELGQCERTGKTAPKECLGHCGMTGVGVLRHLLAASEISGRRALPEHTLQCSLSGKRILMDEAELSAVSGKPVASALLKTCVLTGKRAEPDHFGRCGFTGAEVLNTELSVSEISGKRYRIDRSSVSGKTGHKEEFLFCHETRQPIAPQEAETCEVSGKFVRPGVLEKCRVTGKAVLPSELERCALSDKRVLKKLLVTSSVSAARLQHRLAVRSIAGKYCAPAEAKICMWSGRRCHPDDVRVCTLTGIPFHVEFAASGDKPYLQPLADLLHGLRRSADAADRWEDIASKASTALRGSRCRVETAHVSPDKRHLAICSEVRTMLGFRVHQAGMLYSMEDGSIVGRIAMGKRTPKGWISAAG